jgi:2-oxoglutarate/2-oxoacid ferredoxin oxidoreductase subunit beta
MPDLTTYRNARSYGFCPGCSHRLVLEALDRVLVRLQWDPADTVIVTDIGCVGLSDQYFATSGFHGLHGRSLTYATGIKLARPDLHVINLIGDGGCGIGCAHLVSAARRNIGVTTIVFNNLNFGMTGGEHSVTTPTDQKTATTPWGNTEVPLDIAQTVAVNGATYVWRGTAFDPGLDEQLEIALTHDGFALLDVWELCVAYYATANRVGPKELQAMMDHLGFASGVIKQADRVEGSTALLAAWQGQVGEPIHLANPLETTDSHRLDRPRAIIIAGAAGARVRTAGHVLGTAATLSGLWTTQRDDYPVTVRSGHSMSQVLMSPEPIHFTGISQADVLFVLSGDGWGKTAALSALMREDQWVFVVPELVDRLTTRAQVRVLRLSALKGVAAAGRSLAVVAAGIAHLGFLSPESLIAAAGRLNPAYAEANQAAVRKALAVTDVLFEA